MLDRIAVTRAIAKALRELDAVATVIECPDGVVVQGRENDRGFAVAVFGLGVLGDGE